MNRDEYVYRLLVKKHGTNEVGELGLQKVPLKECRHLVQVFWWTGPHRHTVVTEEGFDYLDILSPEEEAMYRLANL